MNALSSDEYNFEIRTNVAWKISQKYNTFHKHDKFLW